MSLQLVREELNMLDGLIKNMLVLRMSLIPIVAEIKLKGNLPMFQPDRENQMYKEMEEFSRKTGIDNKLVSEMYKLIMTNAKNIQYDMEKNIPPYNIEVQADEDMRKELNHTFEALESIIKEDISVVFDKFNDIIEDDRIDAKNISELGTYYYQNKILRNK
ncbi:MAG: hypothetical protein A2Y22_07955 [Clostridiales bacterium GWD2_32_59]|nr:MAG: hypothetical protein A2Y22_07955 [Clostridiales bacterium GWD2_32_59]